MRRDEFLKLTDIPDHVLKNAFRKSLHVPLLPISGSDAEGWREYSARDVLLSCVTLALAKAGVSQSDASTHVVLGDRWILGGVSIYGEAEDFWFGTAKVRYRENGRLMPDQDVPVCGAYGGLYIVDQVDYRRRLPLAGDDREVVSISIANVSGIRRQIAERAGQFGIDFVLPGSNAEPEGGAS